MPSFKRTSHPLALAVAWVIAAPAVAQQSEQVLPEVKVKAAPEEGYAATRSSTGAKTSTPLNETPQAISVVPRESRGEFELFVIRGFTQSIYQVLDGQVLKQAGFYLQDQMKLERWIFVLGGRNDTVENDTTDRLTPAASTASTQHAL